MTPMIEAMLSRRSCKKFKPDMPKKEDLALIAKAGISAPSGRNLQAPIVLVITDKETRDALSRANAAVMGVESDPFYGAPAVLVVLAKKCNTYLYDGSVAAENILLAAHSLGLGACWIHRAKEVFMQEEYQRMLTKLGIEGEYEGIANCTIGYPADDFDPKPIEKKEGRIFYID